MKKVLFLMVLITNLAFAQEEVKGIIIKKIPFEDKFGKNTLILTETKRYKSTAEELKLDNKTDCEYCRSKEIYAYLYRGKNKIWQVRDFVHNCEDNMEVEFIEKAISITDIDKNGVKEVWLPYTLFCKKDLTPSTMKIIIYEDKTKYAIRGQTKICAKNYSEGGNYKLDKALEKTKNFKKYAINLWNENNLEYRQIYTDNEDNKVKAQCK